LARSPRVPRHTPPVRVNLLPGLHFRYSGGGTTVVQQLLVDVTGEPYPGLLRRLVLEPVGMLDSTFEQPLPQHLHQRAASGHHVYGSRITGRWHVYPEMAAAGLWTTPSDLELDARPGATFRRGRCLARRPIRASGRGTGGL
jgi:CubicO group peptidase (beta-lactamase class C family)